MDKNLILVVDDDEGIRKSITQVLDLEGYQVLEAENGQEALDLLTEPNRTKFPGLIILDLMMPVMDGKAFLKHVSENHLDTVAKIPIIIASANVSFSVQSELPLAVERLMKPFNLDDFLTKVEKYCGLPLA